MPVIPDDTRDPFPTGSEGEPRDLKEMPRVTREEMMILFPDLLQSTLCERTNTHDHQSMGRFRPRRVVLPEGHRPTRGPSPLDQGL